MKKLKKILILILVLAIIIAAIVLIANRNNKKVIVNDYTSGELAAVNEETLDKNSVTASNDEVTATLNKYLKIPTEDDANKINAGITSVSTNKGNGNHTIVMDSVAREVFDAYGKGDIFVLNGNENTPLKEVYFGKIVNKYVNANGELVVETEDPMLDEIFDELSINSEGLMTEEDIKSVQLEDGVTLKWVDSLENEFQEVSMNNNDADYIVNTGSYHVGDSDNIIGPLQKLTEAELSVKKDFVFEFDLGLEYDFMSKKFTTKAAADVNSKVEGGLKLGELEGQLSSVDSKERKSIETTKEKDGTKTIQRQDGDTNTIVQKDSNGTYILPEDIKPQPATDSSYYDDVEEVASVQELVKMFKNNGEIESKVELGLTGKAGVENLSGKVNIDYSLFESPLIRDMNFGFSGNVVAELDFKAEASAEVGGEETKINVPYILKVTGMDKKLIPLAYVDFSGAVIPFGGAYSYIGGAPLAVGLMFYTDLNGKFDFCISAKASYQYGFDINATVWKDGQFDWDISASLNKKIDFEFDALLSFSARFDIIAVSGLVSVANVTIAEVGIVDVYFDVEAQVEFKLKASYNEKIKDADGNPYWDTTGSGFRAHGFGGLFIDAGKLQVKLKIMYLPGSRHSKTFNIDLDKAIITMDVWTFGVAYGAKTRY